MANKLDPREEKLMQYAMALADKMVGEQIERDASITDYNIMMGNLEDPNATEE